MKESTFETVTYFILMSIALLGTGVLIAICSLDAWPSAPAIRNYQSESPQ